MSIFEKVIRIKFPSLWQKNKTAFSSEPVNLKPYTSSAYPSFKGLINFGYSEGSYSKSASRTKIISSSAESIPLFKKYPFHNFFFNKSLLILFFNWLSNNSLMPSVEKSSINIIS